MSSLLRVFIQCAQSLNCVQLFATPRCVNLTVSSGLRDSLATMVEWVAIHSSWVLPTRGVEPRYPVCQVDSLPAEPPGRPKINELCTLLEGFS